MTAEPSRTLTDAEWQRIGATMARPDAFGAVGTEVEAIVAERVAKAEQRGREDNADHAQCYVHGSKAYEALIEQAKQRGRDEVVRDVALVADAALRGVNHDPAAATVVIAVNAALKRHVLARHAGADQ